MWTIFCFWQELLNILSGLLSSTGPVIYCYTPFTFSWLANKKKAKIIYDYDAKFYIHATPPRSLDLREEFQYLGVFLTPGDRILKPPLGRADLMKLKSSLLKPQQKLFLLWNLLLPRYYYLLVPGKTYTGYSKKMVPRFVRQVLHLPQGVPTSAFHTSVKHSGLGLPCLRWTVPTMVL